MSTGARASCKCGKVEFEMIGLPIMCVACYCDDCQAASQQIEALPNASAVREPDGGTAYVLYRKDRFKCIRDEQFLQNHRLLENSPTRRVIASCCNSAMFLDFEKGHWVSVYRARIADAPSLQMRIQTKFSSNPAQMRNDIPTYSTFPMRFILNLVLARVAMLFER